MNPNFNTILRSSFLLALAGLLGSLYFSEVMRFPPCVLCWYQRICMYPLAVIFGVGLWKEDRNVWTYAFPLVLIGLVISVYHNLLYYGIVSEGLVPCQKDLSCTTRHLELFGFLTIPLMSLAGFLMFAILGFSSRCLDRSKAGE